MNKSIDGSFDGMGLKKAQNIIENLKDHLYQSKSTRHTYTLKKSGKLRPLTRHIIQR
jgi:hypothetical protein